MKKIVVLNDGDTFSDVSGCIVVDVPDDVEDIELFLKESVYTPIRIEDMLREREKNQILDQLRQLLKID